MEKKKYTKPSLKVIDIELNELCVGSVCNQVNIFIPEGNKIEKTKVFTKGSTIGDKNMWDSDF